MSKSKHTPGEWEVAGNSIAAPPCNNDGTCIAVIEDDGGYEAPPQERYANARLIAAAPELLAACEAFEELFRNSDMRPEDECHEVSALCRAAIAKATSA